jgi:hypothetical protein
MQAKGASRGTIESLPLARSAETALQPQRRKDAKVSAVPLRLGVLCGSVYCAAPSEWQHHAFVALRGFGTFCSFARLAVGAFFFVLL